MSKVDEWLSQKILADKCKPTDCTFAQQKIATIDKESGNIIVYYGGTIKKEFAKIFANWIIENYSDKSEDQKNHEQHVKFFVEAMAEETNKNSGVDGD